VLHGCPWLLPKALHVLAVPQLAQPDAAMFTLQTRVQQQQVESEISKVCGVPYIHQNQWCCTGKAHIMTGGTGEWLLRNSQVLGHRHADGSSAISVDSLIEGIVAFEDEAMAEAFGHALEAEGHQVP
jgi:hypothetical protein